MNQNNEVKLNNCFQTINLKVKEGLISVIYIEVEIEQYWERLIGIDGSFFRFRPSIISNGMLLILAWSD